MKKQVFILIFILTLFVGKMEGQTCVVITNPAPVCSPATVDLTAGTITAGSTATAFTYWTNPEATTSLSSPEAVTVSGTYYIKGTGAGAECPTTEPVVVTINPIITASVSIGASGNPVCAGTTVTYTATPTNGGTPVYQWKVNNIDVGTNSNIYAYIPVTGDVVKVIMTSDASPCLEGSPATSNLITMTVNPIITASVSIGASGNPVCAGTTVTYTATPTNGGTPVYQWKVNNIDVGTNSNIYAYIPVTGDVVKVIMTSDASPCLEGSPATSNLITMTVNPIITASVSIGASGNPVCAGTTVTYTATPTNGGTPVYQWKVNNIDVGTNSNIYAYIPVTGDVVKVIMTSDASPCLEGSPATSNLITMTVNPIITASVSIGASGNPVCAGTTVTYTATPTNGGTPVYQWKVNNIDVGTNSNIYAYIPVTGDVVKVIMTSDASPCLEGSPATSNLITMTVNPIITASVSIGASGNPVCAGTTVTYTATPTNGGTPVYQWKVNNIDVGTNSNIYAYIPVTGDVVKVIMTSDASPCLEGSPATSNLITMTVNPIITASVSIGASGNPVCAGTTVTYTATPTNGGTPVYQWKVNNIDVGTNSNIYAYIPVTGDVVKVIMTSDASPCLEGSPATSNLITMTVKSVPVFTSTLTPPDICSGTTFNYTATGTPGGTTFGWSRATVTGITQLGTSGPDNVSETLTNETSSFINITYIYLATYNGCSSAPNNVVVKVNPKPAITAMTGDCVSKTAFTVTPANVTNGIVPESTTYVWSAASYSSSELSGGAAGSGSSITGTLTDKKNYAVTATYNVITPTAGSCTGSPFTLTMTVNPGAVISNKTASICNSGTFTIAPVDDSGTTGGDIVPASTTYSWPLPVAAGISGLAAGSSGTANISGTLTNSTSAFINVVYNVTPKSGTVNGDPFTVTVTVEPTPGASISNNAQTLCNGAALTDMVISNTKTHSGTPAFNMVINSTHGNSSNLSTGGNALLPISGGSYNTTISGALTNSTNSYITIQYVITPTLIGCSSGSTATATVTVEPTPVISASDKTICDNTSTALAISTSTTTNNPTYYTWAVSSIGPHILGASANATGTLVTTVLSQPLDNTGSVKESVTYDITPWTGTGPGTLLCPGTAIHVVVTVEPTPVISASDKTICDNTSTALAISTSTTTNNPTYYTWAVSSIGPHISGASANATGTLVTTVLSQTLDNTGSVKESVTYDITPWTGTGPGTLLCPGTAIHVVVTVEPTPVISASDKTICDNTSTALAISTSTTTNNPTYYTWAVSSIGPHISGASANATGTLVTIVLSQPLDNTGSVKESVTYDITPWTGTGPGTLLCPGTAIHVVVTVEPTPVISASDKTICDNTSTALAISTSTTTNNPTYYTWAVSSIGPHISGASANATGTLVTTVLSQPLDNTGSVKESVTYDITPWTGTGPGTLLCPGTAIHVVVTVEPSPSASISNNLQTICNGSALANMVISNTATTIGTSKFDMVINNVIGDKASLTTSGNALTPVADGTYGTGYSINGSLTNPTNAAITIQYVITPKLGTCSTGTPVTATVTVEPTPLISSPDKSVCDNTSADITVSTSTTTSNTTYYTWVIGTKGTNLTGPVDGPATGTPLGTKIIQVIDNTGNVAQSVTYIITPWTGTAPNALLCSGPSITVTLTVEPTPVATISNSTQTICNGSVMANMLVMSTPTHAATPTFDMVINSITGNKSSLSTGGNALTEVTGGTYGVGYIIAGALNNPTNSEITIEYVITPKIGVCAIGTPVKARITVEPTPIISSPDKKVSDNTSADITVSTSTTTSNTTYYTWTVSAVGTNITGASDGPATGTPLTTMITQVLDNTGSAAQTVTYNITPWTGTAPGSLICSGPTVSAVMTVEPTPVIGSSDKTICDNTSTDITVSTSTTTSNPTYYKWTVSGIGTNINGASNGPSDGTPLTTMITQVLDNTGLAAQTVTYNIVPWTGTAPGSLISAGSPITVVVTVEPTPTVSITNSTQTLCDGASLTSMVISSLATHSGIPKFDMSITATLGSLTDLTATGNALVPVTNGSYDYTIGGTLTNNTDASITVEYAVTPKIGTCAVGSTVKATIKVEPTPKAAISNNTQTLCNGASLAGMVISNVTVHSGTPLFDMTINAVTGSLTDLTPTGNALTAMTNGSFGYTVSGTLTNPTNSAITIEYVVTPKFGICTGIVSKSVVIIEPTPTLAIDNKTAYVCNGSNVDITITSPTTPSVPANLMYDVTISSTNSGATGGTAYTSLAGQSFTGTINGTLNNTSNAAITVTYTFTPKLSGCSNGPVITTTVIVNPTTNVNQPSSQIVCNLLNTVAINFSTTMPGSFTTYEWTNDTPSIGLAASGTGDIAAFQGLNTGLTAVVATIVVTPIYTNGIACSGPSKTFTITINASPVANNLTPATLCEDVFGGGTTAGININLTEGDLTSNYPDRLVQWYTSSAHTTLVTNQTNQTVTNGLVYYPRVTNTITGCINYATLTYSVSVKRPPSAVTINGVASKGATLTISYDATASCKPEVPEESEITWYRSSTNTGPGSKITTTTGLDKTYVLNSNDLGKYIRVCVKLSDGSGVLYNAEYNTLFNSSLQDWVGPVSANEAPVASNVTISGTLEATQTLTANYVYSDYENDPQGVSTFKWYTKPSLSDPYVEIPGETGITHVIGLNEQGNYFKFSVTPKAGAGTTTGVMVTSTGDFGPVNKQPTAVASAITGDFEVGKPLTGHYTYSDVDLDTEGVSTFRWLRNGVPIPGATSITYLLVADDETNKITFEVTPVSTTGYPKTGSPAVSPPTVSIAPIVVDFLSFKNVYCYDGGTDTISIKNVPAGSSALNFRMTNTNGFVKLIDPITIVVDPQKMRPARPNSNVVDSLIFSYIEGGTRFNISRPFVIDSIGQNLTLVNINPAYCTDAGLSVVTVDGIYPIGGTGSWQGDLTLLTDMTTNGAKINSTLGTSGNTYAVSYRYTSPKGCLSSIVNKSMKINPKPDPSFALNTYYNVDGGQVTLIPVKTGGTFSGVGVSGDKLVPNLAGTGSFIVTYNITDANNCVNSLSKTTTIKKAQGSFIDIPAVMCYIDTTYKVKLTGLPAGITVNYFTNTKNSIIHVAGTTEGTYSVLAAGAGEDILNFSYKLDGVDYWLSTIVRVDSLAPGTISNLSAGQKVCGNATAFELKAYPTGGVFTGPVVGNFLDPTKALGDTSVTYKYTVQSTGCSASTTVPIFIIKPPRVSFVPADVCIESTSDYTHFINKTISSDPVKTNLWRFSEVGAADVKTTDADFLYTTGGLHSLSLTVTTLNDCIVTKDSTIDLGIQPSANFYWKNDCYSPGKSIKLYDASISNFPVISKTWNFNNGSTIINNVDIPEYALKDTGYLKVQYIIGTKYANCADTVTRNIYLRPTFSIAKDGFYLQGFESGKAGWQKEDSLAVGTLNNNWTLGIPTRFNTIKAGSGKAWYLGYDMSKQDIVKETYSVISPCFDFTDVQKPMISMSVFKRFAMNRNGAALQYKVGDSREWIHLGTVGDGIKWFNSAVINGSPGGDKVGWTSIDGPDTTWAGSSHKLDVVQGKKDVRFRIVYSAEAGTYSPLEGMAFDNFMVSQRSRMVLLEHFTNIGSKAASTATASLNDLIAKNSKDLINIQYHTNFPNKDPYYDKNPGDQSARILSYGLTKVPYSFVDGGNNAKDFAVTVNYGSVVLDTNEVSRRSLINPRFGIKLQSTVTGGVLTVNTNLTSLENLSSDNLILYLVVTEKENRDTIGANGESVFYNVFRKFIPDAGGISLKKVWTKGELYTIPSKTWVIDKVRNLADIEVIAFVQNSVTRELYQATSEIKSDIVVGIENLTYGKGNNFALYPNPAVDRLTIAFEEPLARNSEITIYDLQGNAIKSFKAVAGITEYPIENLALKGGIYMIRITSSGVNLGFKKLIVSGY